MISEEDPSSLNQRKQADCYWLIDPIDGTASFAQGFSGFVTQAAMLKENRPYLSAVYAPISDALYVAKRDAGAYLNGEKLQCPQDGEAVTLIDNYPEPRGFASLAYNALGLKHYIESGSISLKICKVASAEADLFFKDVIVHDWDLAAPHVVLEEAGGFIRNIHGSKIDYTGEYNQSGVVAAPCEKIGMRLISWYSEFVFKG